MRDVAAHERVGNTATRFGIPYREDNPCPSYAQIPLMKECANLRGGCMGLESESSQCRSKRTSRERAVDGKGWVSQEMRRAEIDGCNIQ